jgi:serine/threonine protein kinase
MPHPPRTPAPPERLADEATGEAIDWGGKTLAGRYRVLGLLGAGGMGFVLRAHDEHLNCDVVIKVPRPSVAHNTGFAARFSREVRALVQLSHPHVVKIMDVGTHDNLPFAVLQFLPGGSLRERLERDGPSTPRELKRWLPAVAEALDFIHAEKQVHRDVKPDNILFDQRGNAFLGDFGVVKVLTEQEKAQRKTMMTKEGAIVGTPHFMAPELLLGQPFDGRVDQYALAVTVFACLAGRFPFDGDAPAAVFIKHASEPPPRLIDLVAGVPAGLSAAVEKALAKKQEERFATCTDFARAVFSAIVAGQTRTAPGVRMPTGVAPRPAPPPTLAIDPEEERPAVTARKEKTRRPKELPRTKGFQKGLLMGAAGGLVVVAVLGATLPFVLGGRRAAVTEPPPEEPARQPATASLKPPVAVKQPDRSPPPEPPRTVEVPRVPAPKATPPPPDDTAKPVPVLAAERVLSHPDMVWTVAVAGDGRTFLCAGGIDGGRPSNNTDLYLWAADGGDEPLKVLRGHASRVTAVALSADGKRAVSGDDQGTVILWSTETGQAIRMFVKVHRPGTEGVALSPDGKYYASGGRDKKVRVWTTESGKSRWVLDGHTDTVLMLAFSPDGRTVASGSQDKTVRVWDLRTGEALHALSGHQDFVRGLAYSPDGKSLVTAGSGGFRNGRWDAGSDNDIRVWDVATGKQTFRFPTPGHSVRFLATTPDGRHALTGGQDRRVILWDLRTGKEAARLEGHDNFVLGVAVFPDGTQAVSGSSDKTVRLWKLPPPGPLVKKPAIAP